MLEEGGSCTMPTKFNACPLSGGALQEPLSLYSVGLVSSFPRIVSPKTHQSLAPPQTCPEGDI